MNTNNVDITLLITNKSGTLSFLMLKARTFGLMYRSNKIEKLNDSHSKILVSFEGEINSNQEQLAEALQEHSEVLKVEKIEVEVIGSESISELVTQPVESIAPVVEEEPRVVETQDPPSLSGRHYFM